MDRNIIAWIILLSIAVTGIVLKLIARIWLKKIDGLNSVSEQGEDIDNTITL